MQVYNVNQIIAVWCFNNKFKSSCKTQMSEIYFSNFLVPVLHSCNFPRHFLSAPQAFSSP